MQNIIVIEVQGGSVVEVTSYSSDVQVIVVDRDLQDDPNTQWGGQPTFAFEPPHAVDADACDLIRGDLARGKG